MRIMNLKIDNLNGSLFNKMFMIILILSLRELPLWKTKIMDFFSNKMTFEEKSMSTLPESFLLKKNFYQVWNKIEINPNETFSIKLKIIRFLFKFIFFLFGKKYWHRFQNNYLRYFMDTTGVFI